MPKYQYAVRYEEVTQKDQYTHGPPRSRREEFTTVGRTDCNSLLVIN